MSQHYYLCRKQIPTFSYLIILKTKEINKRTFYENLPIRVHLRVLSCIETKRMNLENSLHRTYLEVLSTVILDIKALYGELSKKKQG